MDLAADLPVTLIVKAANQRVADQTVECVLGWTIRKLKQHLESVYPSKPKHHQQKLIYSGQLLADHLTLKEVLRQYDEENSRHTVHLVCSPSVETLSQPITSASSSSVDKKCEQNTNASQTSVSSNESDGVRHRGAQGPNNAASTSDGQNAGVNPTMGMPGGAAMGGMPGMATVGMPMMGAAAPGMGMPGYPYTPEQVAWMQQMYSQYMAQYMQYYGYQVPAAQDPINPVQAPAPQPAAAANQAPAANNGPANQNMRMNAQGGLEEDDEEEQRDWLDYIYVFFRFLVLVSIVYFYSSFSRFFTVAIGSLIIYMIQNGWMILNRRQQQQRQQQEAQQPPAQPQQQQQQQQQQPEQQQQQNQAERNQTEGQNEGARQGGTEEGREQEAGQSDNNQEQVPAPQPEVPSTPAVFLRMLVTFFTSLVPTQPPAVNGN